jgi:AcrR family transcriptional regulator
MDATQAIYLFYLTWAAIAAPAERSVEGEAPICVHRSGDVAAIVILVPIDEFCGAEAEQRLKDVEWVSTRVVFHEKIVEDGWRRGVVLPCRFGTLFSSFEMLDRFIEAHRPAVHAFLNEVEAEEEWTLKVLVDASAARRWLGSKQAPHVSSSASSPGMHYLRQRRAQADVEKHLREWLESACNEVARSFDDYVTRRRQREIFDTITPDSDSELALSLALLVPQQRRERLQAHVDAINQERSEQGLSFLLNGPWPPYSFCPALEMPA